MHQRVFVDANVLCSRTLRDWTCLLRLRTDGMFQLHTSEDVLAEVVYTLRRLRPERSGGAVTRLRAAILASMDELIDEFDATLSYTGPDPDDRHVHAAAVAGGADILLTEDRGLGNNDHALYTVHRCDEFFVLIDDSAPWMVRDVVQMQGRYWATRPNRASGGLARALRDAGCPEFAARVERHLRALSGRGTDAV
ncbi:PIN domain-containing protein [Curtobacterium sp. ZW137]|uniref:PIN domain-containing protein n=1 Tax=Curtobacterium sp. ZW137 TaxID=2485104 RepID=UPI000F4CB194|nr:PIN domain-containing protein [Curtobacterium sp. ZW137]ROP61116.1 putative nucleic acid-binding protein [Curtobacterium sp. ZW137]